MIYHSNKIIEHGIKLIPVPSERLTKPISDYTEIHSDEKKYKVLTWVTITKLEPIPSILILLSTGKDFSDNELWNFYKKSNRIIFFVCEKL